LCLCQVNSLLKRRKLSACFNDIHGRGHALVHHALIAVHLIPCESNSVDFDLQILRRKAVDDQAGRDPDPSASSRTPASSANMSAGS
jgi:hypothetical protein